METTVTVKEVLQDAKERAQTPNPPFFERISKWAKTAAWIAGGVGTVGLAVISSFASAGIAVPVWIIIGVGVLSGLGAGAGVGAAKVANMTTTNKELLSRPSNEK